ncbi:Trm112 family protein [Pleionea sp. CnH1-48]|uniref:Trm112 family protein n=1 Tax=Pleionea sp. CnH1-48 TaxID=2954494 RepID=UPI0020983035|nr:Trm112 family protein [Pleionea sp. CnH1-48]MCO7225854.1 Trm112 family protein [Pleionea sp. CnH1-48]
MKRALIDILVCPLCNGKLVYSKGTNELICKFDKLAFAVKEQFPDMLIEDARKLELEEVEQLT